VPLAGSASAIVRGIRSLYSLLIAIMTNWPGFAACAIKGASTSAVKTSSLSRLFETILCGTFRFFQFKNAKTLIIRKEELFVKMRILNTEYIEAGAELPQVVKRISPLKNKQRQQDNSANIGYKQQ
jgi:hypothetical protein